MNIIAVGMVTRWTFIVPQQFNWFALEKALVRDFQRPPLRSWIEAVKKDRWGSQFKAS